MAYWIVIALAVGAIALMALAHLRASRISNHHPPSGAFVEVDGVKVHYRIMGSGPDLVLLHGASGNLEDFTLSFTDRLTDRYRVILFDRPGLGWSDRLPQHIGAWNPSAETPLEQAELLIRAADQLGVQRPIVLGHSFGGIVALAWGLTRTEDTAGLVLAGGVAEPWPGDLGWTYTVIGANPGGAVIPTLAATFITESYVNDSIEEIFAPQPAPEGYGAHVGAELILRPRSLRANAQQVNNLRPQVVEMQKRYGTLTLPIEIVHGDADTIVPADVHARVLINDVPNGTLTILPGVGHMPHHTNPDAVTDAIDRIAASQGLR